MADDSTGFKVIALLARKPGVSREEFIEYYEKHHAPLIAELLPPFRAYRRNFLVREGRIARPGAPEVDFDVVSEFVFDDRAGYEAMLAAYGQGDTGRRIADDEAHFLDSSRTRMYVVETYGTPLL